MASYTEVDLLCGSALAEKHYVLECDHPFLFVISDYTTGIPVFTGVVNEMK